MLSCAVTLVVTVVRYHSPLDNGRMLKLRWYVSFSCLFRFYFFWEILFGPGVVSCYATVIGPAGLFSCCARIFE